MNPYSCWFGLVAWGFEPLVLVEGQWEATPLSSKPPIQTTNYREADFSENNNIFKKKRSANLAPNALVSRKTPVFSGRKKRVAARKLALQTFESCAKRVILRVVFFQGSTRLKGGCNGKPKGKPLRHVFFGGGAISKGRHLPQVPEKPRVGAGVGGG